MRTNKKFNYKPRYNKISSLSFNRSKKKYKSNFYLIIFLIILILLSYIVITYQI